MKARVIFSTVCVCFALLGFAPLLADTDAAAIPAPLEETAGNDAVEVDESCQEQELETGDVSWADPPMEAIAKPKPGGPGNICKRFWCRDAGLQCEFSGWSRKGCCLYATCVEVSLLTCPAEEPLPGGACKRQRL